MKTEYQVTPELSLLVREDSMVEYSLHNRIYPQAYTSSILSAEELEESIKKQISVFSMLMYKRGRIVDITIHSHRKI